MNAVRPRKREPFKATIECSCGATHMLNEDIHSFKNMKSDLEYMSSQLSLILQYKTQLRDELGLQEKSFVKENNE
jgi:hypothetical protein